MHSHSIFSWPLVGLLLAACTGPQTRQMAASIRVDTLVTASTLPIELPIGAYPLPSGRIALLDYKASKLLLLDSAGRLQTSYGRPGKGPGEFLRAYGLALHADTLAVFDIGNGRLANFLPDQGFVGVRPLPQGFAHQAFILLDGDTTLHMTDGADSALVVLRSPTGQVLVRYGTPVVPAQTFFHFGKMKQAAAEGRIPDEFKNIALPVLGPQRDVWIIQQATGRIEHFRADGRRLGGLSLSPEHIARRTEEFLRASREVAKDPARMAGIAMISGADAKDGRLWVLLAEPDSVPAQLVVIDTTYTIRESYEIPGAAGSSSLSRDPRTGALYLLNRGEGILFRLWIVPKSAA